MKYDDLLRRFTEMSLTVFGENLAGVYLHGSLAMGCFNPEKSDLDLILIVERDISDDQKLTFLNQVVELNREAPPKGLELSVVKREHCAPFVYPTPFEFHFSPAHLALALEDPEAYIQKLQGTDKDLGAHFTIINHYGIVLYGEKISGVFAPVPMADYIDSIWSDVEGAREEILENPVYMVLNLCRVLAYLQDGLVLSKQSGGVWGVEKLSEAYKKIVVTARRCYESDTEMKIDQAEALKFADYMISAISRIREEKGI